MEIRTLTSLPMSFKRVRMSQLFFGLKILIAPLFGSRRGLGSSDVHRAKMCSGLTIVGSVLPGESVQELRLTAKVWLDFAACAPAKHLM